MLVENFKKNGYSIVQIESKELDCLKRLVGSIATKDTGLKSDIEYLHDYINKEALNKFRVKCRDELNANLKVNHKIYEIIRKEVHALVGNELCVQKKTNLSIQLPNDGTSLLPLHTDDIVGNSSFELITWIPLTNTVRTQSIFLLNLDDSENVYLNLDKYSSTNEVLDKYQDRIVWPELKYGEILLFSARLFHGNVENEESTTRWSLNLRFKSLFSPLGEKGIGDYFEPLTIMPVTEIGLKHWSEG